MKNRKFLLIVSLVLAMTMSLGGTLAYLQDTDADVNTMVLGNVTIEQIEKERIEQSDEKLDEKNLQVYTQDKPLVPAVGPVEWADEFQKWPTGGSNQLFTDDLKNVQDKFVFVENTGKTDAYVRTIFAFEAGSLTVDEINNGLIHWNRNGNNWKWSDFSENMKITIDGADYYVREAVYTGNAGADKNVHPNGVLPKDETTRPSLLQVFLDSKATNEDMERIDGNKNGTYDILVLSQAIQAEGFEADATTGKSAAQNALDTGFGEVDADNVKEWFGGWETWGKTTVANDEELAAAIEAGETEIVLKAGTYHMPAAAKGKTLTLIGESTEAVIEVVPAGQDEANGQLDYNLDGSTVTFNNLTIKTNSQLYAGFARLSGTYNNCVIQNTYNLGTGNSVFNDCTFNITNEYLRVGGAYSAEFNGCTFNTEGRAILVFQDGTSVDQTVTVKDCTFNATAAANTWNGIHVAAVSIDGTSGTYVVNLEGNNVVDSDFNGLWQIKAGEANVTVNE